MRRFISTAFFLGVLAAALSAQAQNLLVNGNLDLTGSPPAQVYYDGFDPSVADDVPGWLITLGAADGSYVLVSPSADPPGNVYDADMAIGPAGGGLQTAAASRPVVTPGTSYTATVTYDNYFGPNTTSYFIDWFNGSGTLLSSVGGPLLDPNGPLTYTPYTQLFSVVGVAPAGAATAGVRFTSGDGSYNGLAADNFTLSAVPEPGTLVLCLGSVFMLLGMFRRSR